MLSPYQDCIGEQKNLNPCLFSIHKLNKVILHKERQHVWALITVSTAAFHAEDGNKPSKFVSLLHPLLVNGVLILVLYSVLHHTLPLQGGSHWHCISLHTASWNEFFDHFTIIVVPQWHMGLSSWFISFEILLATDYLWVYFIIKVIWCCIK